MRFRGRNRPASRTTITSLSVITCGLALDTLDDKLECIGVSLRNFYALRTTFDLINIVKRLDAVIIVTVENETEPSVLINADVPYVLIA